MVDAFCQVERQVLLGERQDTELPPLLVTEVKQFNAQLAHKVIHCELS